MATSVILPYYDNISYITLLWQHQLYYPFMVTSVILPDSGNISYITLLWQHQLYYPILATSVILPYHGKRNQMTFLEKLRYHLKMVKVDDIYLQKFSFLHLKSRHHKNCNCVQVNGSSSHFLVIISKKSMMSLGSFCCGGVGDRGKKKIVTLLVRLSLSLWYVN